MGYIRKRVTRVGSGAYSIYLPKKWIEDWCEKQKESMEVELLTLGEHLIVSPIVRKMEKEIDAKLENIEEAKYALISSYINGYENFKLNSRERLKEEVICGAMAFTRSLDENIVARVSENSIACTMRAQAQLPTYKDLLSLLFDRNLDIIEMAKEILFYYELNPNRTLHIMKMVYSIEEEDIDRLTYQILRLLVNLQVQVNSLSELYFLCLVSDVLERIGDALIGIVELVCELYGINKEHLSYPIEILEKELHINEVPSQQEMKKLYIDTLEMCIEELTKAKKIVLERNGYEALAFSKAAAELRIKFEKELFSAVSKIRLEKSSAKDKRKVLTILKIGHRLRELITRIESFGKRTAQFYYSI
ncbi:MAG: hypothetical protein AB1779_06010 [Candidatus Thermoplasmatota archaeon]